MATATSISNLPISTELDTLVVVDMGKDADGNPQYKAVSEKDAAAMIEEKKAVEVFRQTAKFYSASSDAGMVELCPDEGERVLMFNRGATVKQQNRFRSTLLATDEDGNLTFEPTTDAYDLRESVASPTQRRGLSDTEKAIRAVQKLNLDDAALAQVLAALKPSA